MSNFNCVNVCITFLLTITVLRIHCQVLRNRYSDVYKGDNRGRQYPHDYYDRYPPNDRYHSWDSSSVLTGFYSIYSDSRCLNNRAQQINDDSSVSVSLRLGKVIGTYVYLCDGPGVNEHDRPDAKPNQPPKIYKNLTIFFGIPYALPPTPEDDRRFRPPQVQPSFSSKRAVRYQSSCPQLSMYKGPKTGITDTDENCLYLNVFSPSVKSNEKYAVMVYIHGGNWDHGSANIFPAHMLAASQEVVVVTFNYRLGPLGFYATGENSSAGNFGLLDQALAIEWVYDNIEAFNGDNEKITLFGPGVGAASAGIHAFSHRLGKKIRRVIAQSGSAVADWAIIRSNYTVVQQSKEYASLYNCNFQSSYRTVTCLRGAPLNFFESTYFKPKVGWYPWTPVVDVCTREANRRILPDIPENMIKFHYENSHEDFAYLTGVTKDEAISMLWQDLDLIRNNYRITKEKLERKIQEFSSVLNYTLDIPALTKAIQFMYMPKEKDYENETLLRESYVNMLSDSYFKAPNDKMVKLLLQRNIRTYMYVLNNSLEGLHFVHGNPRSLWEDLVPHDTEYYLVTGAPFMDPKLYPSDLNLNEARWTEADRNLSMFFMTAWANFAKFGNPTPAKLFDNILWEPVDLKHMQYLSINSTNFSSVMMSSYHQKESQFWNSFLPTMLKQDFFPSTYCQPLYAEWEDQKHIYEASLWGVLAAILLSLIFCILCSCLYCRAKSKHVVSTEDIPDAISVTPSSIDTLLHMKRIEAGNKYFSERLHAEQKHTQV
ncbi:esterase FE4 [Trichonephila inaurata madagascariensis]|uniref:Esterase FE4 n=1 Tax=Trichonephila inaurata madagascariensis TaxID=2747483 RepID=A0A8X7BP36_9ARAC|nr:esterase FE4 [Trichonephila inaurata madagascariensis]